MMADSLPYDAEIEYLTNTGTQYIDIGESLSVGTTSIKLVFEAKFSAFNYNGQSLIIASSRPNLGVQIYTYSTDKIVNQRAETTITNNTKYLITTISTATQKSIQINNGAVVTMADNISVSDGSVLYLLGTPNFSASSRCARGTYYSFKVFRNDVLIKDLIPVRVGTTGYMYDKVSKQLFGNAGTGDFILGNDINT